MNEIREAAIMKWIRNTRKPLGRLLAGLCAAPGERIQISEQERQRARQVLYRPLGF